MLPLPHPAGGGLSSHGTRERALTKVVGLLIAWSAAAAIPAVAQVASGAGGPSGLHFEASGDVLYDSNELRSPKLNADGSSPARDDVRYSPALSASYGRSTGRATLAVNGLVGYDFFQNNSYLNRNRYSGGGTLGYSAGGRCSASVNGTYSSRQNGISNLGVLDPTLPPPEDVPPDDVGRLIDNRQIVGIYGVSANCGSGGGGRLSFGGSATHSGISNSAPTRRFADSNSDIFSGFVGIGVFRPGQLQLTGSYSTIGYPNRLMIPGVMLPAGFSSGVKTYRVGLNYTRPIGTKLSGSIGVAYLTGRPDNGQNAYTSPAYNIGLTYLPSDRLSFALNGSRDIIASTTAGAEFRVVDLIDLSASYKLGRAITARASAGFIQNQYRQTFTTPDELIPRGTETSKLFGVTVVYQPRPLYDIGLNVSQTFRNSSPSIYNYNSTKAGVSLAIHI